MNKNMKLLIVFLLLMLLLAGCSSKEVISKPNDWEGVWESGMISLPNSKEAKTIMLYIVDNQVLLQENKYKEDRSSYSLKAMRECSLKDISSRNTDLILYTVDSNAEIIESEKWKVELVGDELLLRIDDDIIPMKHKAEIEISRNVSPKDNIKEIALNANPEMILLDERVKIVKQFIDESSALSGGELINLSGVKSNIPVQADDVTVKAIRFTGKKVPEILVCYNIPSDYFTSPGHLKIYQYSGEEEWKEIYNVNMDTAIYFHDILNIKELGNEQVIFYSTGGMLMSYGLWDIFYYVNNKNIDTSSDSDVTFNSIVIDPDDYGDEFGGTLSIDKLTNSLTFKYDDKIWILNWDGEAYVLDLEKSSKTIFPIKEEDFSIFINDKILSLGDNLGDVERILGKAEISIIDEAEHGMPIHDNTTNFYKYEKDDLMVCFVGNDNQKDFEKYSYNIYVKDSKYPTYRGLKVGDSYEKMVDLYGTTDVTVDTDIYTVYIYSMEYSEDNNNEIIIWINDSNNEVYSYNMFNYLD